MQSIRKKNSSQSLRKETQSETTTSVVLCSCHRKLSQSFIKQRFTNIKKQRGRKQIHIYKCCCVFGVWWHEWHWNTKWRMTMASHSHSFLFLFLLQRHNEWMSTGIYHPVTVFKSTWWLFLSASQGNLAEGIYHWTGFSSRI